MSALLRLRGPSINFPNPLKCLKTLVRQPLAYSMLKTALPFILM
jgi:hypothetical protein